MRRTRAARHAGCSAASAVPCSSARRRAPRSRRTARRDVPPRHVPRRPPGRARSSDRRHRRRGSPRSRRSCTRRATSPRCECGAPVLRGSRFCPNCGRGSGLAARPFPKRRSSNRRPSADGRARDRDLRGRRTPARAAARPRARPAATASSAGWSSRRSPAGCLRCAAAGSAASAGTRATGSGSRC